MIEVKKLYDRVNSPRLTPNKRFPELHDSDPEKPNILYLACMLNQHGLYRTLLPKLELSRRGFNVMVNNILRDNQGEIHFDNYEIDVKRGFIEWADYIVLPALTENMGPFLRDLRKANKNATICFDIDRVYHKISSKSAEASHFDVHSLDRMMKNFSHADVLIFPNNPSAEYYDKQLIKYTTNSNIQAAFIPNLLSEFQFEGIKKKEIEDKKHEEVFTLLIYTDEQDYIDLNSNRDFINTLLKKHPNIEILIYGKSLTWKNQNAARDIPHKFVKQTSILNKYVELSELNVDLAFIPISHREDLHRHEFKYLELSYLGIPIITYNRPPYSEFAEFMFIGEKRKDLYSLFDEVIKDRSLLEEIAENAQTQVQENQMFNKETIDFYTKTFVK